MKLIMISVLLWANCVLMLCENTISTLNIYSCKINGEIVFKTLLNLKNSLKSYLYLQKNFNCFQFYTPEKCRICSYFNAMF